MAAGGRFKGRQLLAKFSVISYEVQMHIWVKFLVLAIFLVGCGSDKSGTPVDASAPIVDAPVPPVDASNSSTDAGAMVDAGVMVDAGMADAGTVDAGVMVDAGAMVDGSLADANPNVTCNPLASFPTNSCPGTHPRCSYAFIQTMPNLVIQTKCLGIESGATTSYDDECNQFLYDPNDPIGDTCGALGLSTPNDPTDDQTFACAVVGQTARCHSLCNIDPAAVSGCDAGWSCTGFANIFEDIPQSVGFCSPGCDPLKDPTADPNGVINERCTVAGTQCYALASGTRTCSSPGSVSTAQDCQFLNDCAGPGQSCRDFNEAGSGNSLSCGLYCDPTVAPSQQTYNLAANNGTLGTCGQAIAATSHPNAGSPANFTCLPLQEIMDDPTISPSEGTCHYCPASVGGNDCCDPANPTQPNLDPSGQPFCFDSCLTLLGCPLPSPILAQPVMTNRPSKSSLSKKMRQLQKR